LLGAAALVDGASAQNYGYASQPYWSGAPNAAGPAGTHHRRYGRYGAGYPMDADVAAPPARPYWSGAPNAAGPAGIEYANNGPIPFLPFAPLVYGATNAAGTVVGGAANTASAIAGGPYYSNY
jgi:hypothetical protein